MVDLTRIELATLRHFGSEIAPAHNTPFLVLKLKSPAFAELLNFGPDKDRTCDLLHAMQALSQLSYRPVMYIVYQFYPKSANQRRM